MSKINFLNTNLQEKDNCNVNIYGVQYCSSDFLQGVELGPTKLRELSIPYSNADGTSFPIKIYNPLKGYVLEKIKINDHGNFNIDNLTVIKNKINNNALNLFLAGDHATTFYILNELYNNKKINVIQFDAHSDFINEFSTYPHGSVMNEVNKLSNINKIYHCGLRGNLNTGPGIKESIQHGNEVLIDRKLTFNSLEKILDVEIPLYITFDVDFFDPSIAPATSCVEPGGWLYNETIDLLDGIIRKYKVIGVDIVEFNPKLDVSNITGNLIVNLIISMMSSYGDNNER